MTLKEKLILSALLVVAISVNNCMTVAHDASMRSELAIKSDKHVNVQRPLEVTHDVQDKILKGEATGLMFWIPGLFDLMVSGVGSLGNVLGSGLRSVGGALGGVPFVGKSLENGASSAGANVGNIGPLINNFKILLLADEAEGRIVYDNNIDGFYRTGVHATIGLKWFIFKEYKVEVTGKPVVIKSLGMFTDARLAKIQAMTAKAGCTTCADIK
jgi:hypothetical protein